MPNPIRDKPEIRETAASRRLVRKFLKMPDSMARMISHMKTPAMIAQLLIIVCSADNSWDDLAMTEP